MKESQLKTLLKHVKYRLILLFVPRKNRVYTQFYRFPNQYKALVDRILPLYNARKPGHSEPVEIVMFACCNGAETFSLSHVIHSNFPDLKYRIRAYDIVEDVVKQAQTFSYTREQVYAGPFVTDEFVSEVFDVGDDNLYRVKPYLSAPVSFYVGDMLDESFMRSLGKANLVFAQNVLFHLPKRKAHEAFRNLCDLLKQGSTLFINGMDTDMRIKLSKRFRLQPNDYLIEEIHNDARVDRGAGWSRTYWGREPFTRNCREWIRKQCTIFDKV